MLPFGEWVAAAGHAGALLGGTDAQRVHAMLELAPRRTPWAAAALATVQGRHVAAAKAFGDIGNLSDRALALAWAAKAAGENGKKLDKALLDELCEFADRNKAPGLRPVVG
jgi:hypothetical protein